MSKTSLTKDQISRYSRQLLVESIGVSGQERIVNGSVLVVGAGGLGAPVLMYLAAAGVGRLGILDYDVLEESNLQRQVIHSERNVGKSKVHSAAEFVQNLNSTIQLDLHELLLDSVNALDILSPYVLLIDSGLSDITKDIVVDCTDNVATRYLLNDCCVFLNKPLVSGGAIRLDGQITVYNIDNGPCLRCVFPNPPKQVDNCSDVGVLGAITGVVGSLQALETLKILMRLKSDLKQKMILLDGDCTSLRQFKMRGKNIDCLVCSDKASIKAPIDYVAFCGSGADDKTPEVTVSSKEQRIGALEFKKLIESQMLRILDVRPKVEFDICALPSSIRNVLFYIDVPFKNLSQQMDSLKIKLKNEKVYVVCRRGNESQLAVQDLLKEGIDAVDVVGGLLSYAKHDLSFPKY